MQTEPQTSDAWWDEALAMNPCERDWDVAASVVLPDALFAHTQAADLDGGYEACRSEWAERIYGCDWPTLVMLAIERCCTLGVLLPWDMRGARLLTAPSEVFRVLDRFYNGCPRHVAALISHETYWVVRSERARRTGSPAWKRRQLELSHLGRPFI